MLQAGARGETLAEMRRAFHITLPEQRYHQARNALEQALLATNGRGTQLGTANQVWVRAGLAIDEAYEKVLGEAYGAPVAELDIAADADAARRLINGWVSDRTRQRIPELVPADTIDGATTLVLVNALVLDALWTLPFDARSTRDGSFHLADGATVSVAMMDHPKMSAGHRLDDATEVVELGYEGGRLSMIIVMPPPGRDPAMLVAEPAKLLRLISDLPSTEMTLSLPRFIARAHAPLVTTLRAMGMESVFSDTADFSGITRDRGLFVDSVDHEAYVKTTESGTEAAAATAISMTDSPVFAHVVVDRPFLFLIRDRETGAIIFLGRVADPRE
jgi:serpin B